MENRYRPGTIVSARGREWIVLPEREPEVLRLRPLTTAHGEEVGLFIPIEGERVRPARFADPEPMAGGDDSEGSRPRIRDDVAPQSDLMSLGVPR